jgi:hypothetical protein
MSIFFIVKAMAGGGWPPVESQKLQNLYSVLSFSYHAITESQKLQNTYAITFLNYA